MKKTLLTSFLFLTISQLAHAQWTNSGSNVYINSGFVGIGTTNPQNSLDIQRVGSANTGAILSIQGFENSASGGGYLRLIKSRGIALGSQVTTLSGDVMGTVDYMGIRPNNTLGYSARIIGYQDGAAGTNYIPGKLSFFTGSPDNTLLERMTIISSGNIGIGTATPDEKLVVSGNIKTILEPAFPTKNNVSIRNLGFSGITGALNWTIRGVYQYPLGVNSNADGGDLDIIKSLDGNTVLATKSDGTALGNVAIGTIDPKGYKLAVNGSIIGTSVTVKVYPWPDYVFKEDYQLRSLAEVKTYIEKNQHLPEIPSQEQIAKEGLNLGEMNKLLMKKVEELTLYLIEKDNELKQERTKNELQQTQINKMNQRMEEMDKQLKLISLR